MILQTNLERLLNFLERVNPEMEREALLLILLTQLSRISLLNRHTVHSDLYFESETPVNIYAINFMPSGAGKDRTIAEIDHFLMSPFWASFNERRSEYVENEVRRLQEIAEEQEMTEKGARSFIKENKPRELGDEFSEGTLEGIVAVREEFQRAGFGGTFINISEFADYIQTNSVEKERFLRIVKEIYEQGNSSVKAIKSDNTYTAVRGVPCSALFQSSPEGLLDGDGAELTLRFLTRGLARRAMIYITTSVKEYEKASAKERRLIKRQIREEAAELRKIVSCMVNSERWNFELSEEAEDWLDEHDLPMAVSNEAISAEFKSRIRKAIKLSGLIALIEHPNDATVGIPDIESAWTIVNNYSAYLRKFIDLTMRDPEVKLFDFLKENAWKPFSKTDLKLYGFIAKNRFAEWFDGAIEKAKVLAEAQGCEIVVSNSGRNTTSVLLKN